MINSPQQLCPSTVSQIKPFLPSVAFARDLVTAAKQALKTLSLPSIWDHRPLPLGPASYFYLSLLSVALAGSILIPFLSVCVLSWKAALTVSCIGVTQPPAPTQVSTVFKLTSCSSSQHLLVPWELSCSQNITCPLVLFSFFPTPADTAQAFGWLVICLHSYLGVKGCLVS